MNSYRQGDHSSGNTKPHSSNLPLNDAFMSALEPRSCEPIQPSDPNSS